MAPSGIAHQADALRVDPEIGRLGAHELDCRFHVVDAARIGAGLAEAVVDGEQRIAIAGEEWPPILVGRAASGLPSSAMDRNDHRGLVEPLRQIEIARQIGAVVLDKFQIGPSDDFIIPRPCTRCGKH